MLDCVNILLTKNVRSRLHVRNVKSSPFTRSHKHQVLFDTPNDINNLLSAFTTSSCDIKNLEMTTVVLSVTREDKHPLKPHNHKSKGRKSKERKSEKEISIIKMDE